MTLSERITALAVAIGLQLKALAPRLLAPDGAVGQIPVRAEGGAMAWIDAPEGSGVHGIPPGGATGQILTKASGDDFDVVWSTPAGGGGGGAEAPTKVVRGFHSNVVSGGVETGNALGVGYGLYLEAGSSVISYSASLTAGDSGNDPQAFVPNITVFKIPPGYGWKTAMIYLGDWSYQMDRHTAYFKRGQPGSFVGKARFFLSGEREGAFFVGAVSGSRDRIWSGVRGWDSINASGGTTDWLSGMGFDYSDANIQFMYIQNSGLPVRIDSGVSRHALFAGFYEARLELSADKTELIASIIDIPTGAIIVGPQALPLSIQYGYTLAMGRGVSAFQRTDGDAFLGFSSLDMTTDY